MLSQGSMVRYPVWQHTFVSPSAFSRRAVVTHWRKYVHEELVNRLGGLSLPRKSVARLTDRPDMTLNVYRGRKKQYNNNNLITKHLYYPYANCIAVSLLLRLRESNSAIYNVGKNCKVHFFCSCCAL